MSDVRFALALLGSRSPLARRALGALTARLPLFMVVVVLLVGCKLESEGGERRRSRLLVHPATLSPVCLSPTAVLSPPYVGLGFVLSSDFLILYKSLGLNKMSNSWLKQNHAYASGSVLVRETLRRLTCTLGSAPGIGNTD